LRQAFGLSTTLSHPFGSSRQALIVDVLSFSTRLDWAYAPAATAAVRQTAIAARRVDLIGNRCMEHLLPSRAMPSTVPAGGADRESPDANRHRTGSLS
jgi:hypothetical protein